MNRFNIKGYVNKLFPIIVIIAQISFSGCATIDKQNTIETQTESASVLTKKGQAEIAKWERTGDYSFLKKAESYFSQALISSPHEAINQSIYYNILYKLSVNNWRQWGNKLESRFDKLDDLVKENSNPPGLARYLNASSNYEKLENPIELLKDALSRQPKSYIVWVALGEEFLKEEQMELALFNGQRAIAINPEIPIAYFLVLETIEKQSGSQSCIYDGMLRPDRSYEYANNIVLKLISLQDEDIELRSDLSLNYSAVGLYPLAFEIAKKAYKEKPSSYTRDALATALLGIGNIEEAKPLFRKLVEDDNSYIGQSGLISIAVRESDFQKASHLMKSLTRNSQKFHDYLYNLWIDSITSNKDREQINQSLKLVDDTPVEDDWQRLVVEILLDENRDVDELVNAAEDVCQQTEAYFYSAMKNWMLGSPEKSKMFLKKTASLNTYDFIEHIRARDLLESNIF